MSKLTVKDIAKRYGARQVVKSVSLELESGEVVGLLGPNGAGKTTVLRVVMGFIFPDAGEVDRGGLATARIGYLPERAFYPPRFSVRDYLLASGRLAGQRADALPAATDRLLAQFGLGQAATKKLGACSRGMLQRVGLAQALIGDPPLLLLDEPASGLDPAGQKFMREQILALREAGKTILLSSHHLDEVTRVCSHVAVISQGRLVRSGPLEGSDGILELRTVSEAMVTILAEPLPPDLAARLASLSPGITATQGRITLAGQGVERKAEVLRLLLESGADVRHLSERRATLEEIYLEATGG